ncbi:hypothetical protein [Actinomycetospora sp. NBRC 106378]|uniref:hypothetical protein n=1 Tax=Actinomycetospora sp. NBRC 106378 TaxID=3032208 RepID=UPI0024A2A5E8|nr:hypothetical protein [Actinomycetospora sp. NBRC 106378]GLZ52822.1 hypothetical protein Acsp07_24390 [Actinomycetospora sp. NBRC 106378]
MTHAPHTGRPGGPSRSLRRHTVCPRPATWRTRAVDDVRAALALACLGDGATVPFDLLGAGPVRSRADLAARVETLTDALLERMDAEGWDPGAAPRAVTSVLAASVPAVEAALLRAASGARLGEMR